MRYAKALLGAGALALASGFAMPVHADPTYAVCTFTTQVVISPGVGPTPSDGTFATPEPGSIECSGGVAGTGTISYSGNTGPLGESCALDLAGTGTLDYQIEENAPVTGTFTFGRAAVAGGFTADTTAGPLVGSFEFAPAEGQDCATTPVTEATVTGQALVLYY